MQYPPYILYIHPEMGPVTPMELDYHGVYSALQRYAAQGRQAEVDEVVRQIDKRFNPQGGKQERLLFPERSVPGIVAMLNFIGGANRTDGITLSVPGRIPYKPGVNTALDKEMSAWISARIAVDLSKMQEKLRRAEDELNAEKEERKAELDALRQRHEREIASLRQAAHSAPPRTPHSGAAPTAGGNPPARPMSAPPFMSDGNPPGAGVVSRAEHEKLARDLGSATSELELARRQRDDLSNTLQQAKEENRDLTWKVNLAEKKSNELAEQNRQLREECDRLTAEHAPAPPTDEHLDSML